MTMARFMDSIEGLAAFHEPKPHFHDEIEGFLKCTFDVEEFAVLLRQSRDETHNHKEYVESSCVLPYCIPPWAKAFPSSRYIWLVRDGRDVVSSLYRLGEFSKRKQQEMRDNSLVRRFGLDWFSEMSTESWREMPEFDKCCWYWARTNKVVQEGLARMPAEKWLLLHLEYLDSEKELLSDRFGLRITDRSRIRVLNQGYGRRPYKWTSWTEHHREVFAKVCGCLMDELYPRWRQGVLKWKPTQVLRGGGRARLWLQQAARRLIYHNDATSRWILDQGKRVPWLKGLVKRLVGRQ